MIASNDRSAIGVLDGLRKNGFMVPQDIALIGFDDRLEARALVPSLTTVHYPMFGLGYQAVELLLRAIKGESVLQRTGAYPDPSGDPRVRADACRVASQDKIKMSGTGVTENDPGTGRITTGPGDDHGRS